MLLMTNRGNYQKIRLEVIGHYSPTLKCQGCGFLDMRALTIDHINGGGNKHRKEVGSGYDFYNWLKKNNYPKGFQVLCMNCQFIKVIDETNNDRAEVKNMITAILSKDGKLWASEVYRRLAKKGTFTSLATATNLLRDLHSEGIVEVEKQGSLKVYHLKGGVVNE